MQPGKAAEKAEAESKRCDSLDYKEKQIEGSFFLRIIFWTYDTVPPFQQVSDSLGTSWLEIRINYTGQQNNKT